MIRKLPIVRGILIVSLATSGLGTVATSQTHDIGTVDAPPAVTAIPLPSLPATPVLSTENYPACREDFQKSATPFDKVIDINRCTTLIDAFYQSVMLPFRRQMIAHQNEISSLYTEKVGGNAQYPVRSQQDFYRQMMKEHADSDPDGPNLAQYRAMENRFQQDRSYLQDRYCFNTGCAGYPVPTTIAALQPPAAKVADVTPAPKTTNLAKTSKTKASASTAATPCKSQKRKGSFVGGLLGSVAGQAAGLRGAGALIASQFAGILVSEIACQLNEKEQEKAAGATTEVVKKETVGAVAVWQSPNRSGVTGSSTVTALNSDPSGTRCLSITDVAIVEGVETRVAKQMCRKPGDDRYTMLV